MLRNGRDGPHLLNIIVLVVSSVFATAQGVRARARAAIHMVFLNPTNFSPSVSNKPYGSCRRKAPGLLHPPRTAFRHLPPNSARIGYSAEGALFISSQLSIDAVRQRPLKRFGYTDKTVVEAT